MVSAPFQTSVLFIEDDSKDFLFWSHALQQCPRNYVFSHAYTGGLGVEIFKASKFNCVVLDLDLPDSSYDVMQTLIPNQSQTQVPIVVLTGLKNANLHEIALYMGVKKCLLKQDTSGQVLDLAIQNAVASVAAYQEKDPLLTLPHAQKDQATRLQFEEALSDERRSRPPST